MIDIDNFKQYNGDNGHMSGDVCLKAVAEAIRTSIRPSDLLGRLGGEEFAILLAGTAIESSAGVAERMRTRVEQAEIKDHQGRNLPTATISIGVAQSKTDAFYQEALESADAALYRAKNKGRNCIVYESS